MSVTLSAARYGKDQVRVFRIVREGNLHHVVEYSVTTLLEGDIDTSYTKADNSVIVATDSIKNITYYLAKVSPHILIPERFALHLGTHIASKYAHIHKVFVTVKQLRWTRIFVDGSGHDHSFYRDGDDKRIINVEIDATKGKENLIATVTSGVSDLLVLKSSGSSFSNFVRDEYTTLTDVDDRIFSTSVDLTYKFAPFKVPIPTDDKLLNFGIPAVGQGAGVGTVWDADVPARARKATLEVFATDDSASVQATLYKMAERLIAENVGIQTVSYSLPNKHYIPVDMKYIGIDNVTPLSIISCLFFICSFPCIFGRYFLSFAYSLYVLASLLFPSFPSLGDRRLSWTTRFSELHLSPPPGHRPSGPFNRCFAGRFNTIPYPEPSADLLPESFKLRWLIIRISYHPGHPLSIDDLGQHTCCKHHQFRLSDVRNVGFLQHALVLVREALECCSSRLVQD